MIQKVLAAIFAISSLVGIVYAVEAHYATKIEMASAKEDLEEFKVQYAIDRSQSRIKSLTERVWKIDDRISELKDRADQINKQTRSQIRAFEAATDQQSEIKKLEEQRRELLQQIKEEEKNLDILYKNIKTKN